MYAEVATVSRRGASPLARRSPGARVRRPAWVLRGGAQLLLDPQQLVVLRDAICAARRARLDLAAAGGDREVGDRHVLRLAGAVRHDRRVAVAAGELDRVQRLGQRPDLVDLDEDRVRDALVDAALQALDAR